MTAAEVTITEGAKLRSKGFNCVPTLNAIGHCVVPHAAYRDAGMPAEAFDDLARAGSHGCQLALGVQWGLACIDIDGELGASVWSGWAVYRDCPATVTGRTPRDGWQFWYAIPPNVQALPKTVLWDAGGHQGIELLADRCMARVYPSYKTIDGRKVSYAWLPGRAPGECPMATLPRWIIAAATAARKAPIASGRRPGSVSPRWVDAGETPRRHALPCSTWQDVRDGIADKVSLAHRWGLRITGSSPNAAGWISCRSIFREDRNPSARFHASTGNYWESGLAGQVVNFFDVAIALGAFPDFKAAVQSLGRS